MLSPRKQLDLVIQSIERAATLADFEELREELHHLRQRIIAEPAGRERDELRERCDVATAEVITLIHAAHSRTVLDSTRHTRGAQSSLSSRSVRGPRTTR